MFQNEYAAVLITADSVRDGIDQEIIRDLFSIVECQVVHSCECFVEPWMIPVMYRKIANRNYYPSVVRNMTCGRSVFYLVVGEGGLREKLSNTKGSFRGSGNGLSFTGLRAKYRGVSIDSGKPLSIRDSLDRTVASRLHTTSNNEETALNCLLFMKRVDVLRLSVLAPDIFLEIQKATSQLSFFGWMG